MQDDHLQKIGYFALLSILKYVSVSHGGKENEIITSWVLMANLKSLIQT